MGKVKTSLFFAAVMGILSLYGHAWAVEGPIAHWTFDEGQGDTVYDAADGHDGTVHGATWTTGVIGGALSFDGSNDYVSIPDDDSLEGMSELTITMWVKPNRFSNYDCLIHKGGWNEGFVAHMEIPQTLFWGISVGAGKRVSSFALTLDEWQFLTLWFRGNDELRIYRNGINSS